MDHALPGVEAFLITLVAVFAFQLLVIVFSFMLATIIVFGLIFVFASDGSPLIIVLVSIFGIALGLALIGVLMATSAVVQALSTGGLTGVLKKVVHGDRYEFGDVFSTGWGSKGPLFRISLLTILVLIPLVWLPVSVVLAPVIVLSIINPFFTFFLFFIYIFVLFAALIAQIFTVPLLKLPHIVHWNEGKVGWQAVKGGFSFAMRYPGEVFGLGFLYMVAAFISRMVPGVGLLLNMVGPPYMVTCLQVLYDRKNGTKWKKGVR